MIGAAGMAGGVHPGWVPPCRVCAMTGRLVGGGVQPGRVPPCGVCALIGPQVAAAAQPCPGRPARVGYAR